MKDELKMREEFQENFGSYLPHSLCPPIYEPPVKFSIVPEKTKTNLPIIELTLEEIQDIKKNYSLDEEK
jgi:hypothetical protein